MILKDCLDFVCISFFGVVQVLCNKPDPYPLLSKGAVVSGETPPGTKLLIILKCYLKE